MNSHATCHGRTASPGARRIAWAIFCFRGSRLSAAYKRMLVSKESVTFVQFLATGERSAVTEGASLQSLNQIPAFIVSVAGGGVDRLDRQPDALVLGERQLFKGFQNP